MKHITNPSPKAEYKNVSWQSIKNDVKKVNPELANIINALPTKNLNLKLGTYSYGALIGSGTDENNTPPVFLVLEKACELFLTYKQQYIPFKIIKRGEICFPAKALKKRLPSWQHEHWSISAGARNVFMLPSISDAEKHNNLQKKLNFEIKKPSQLHDQWETFRLIANSGHKQEDWECKVLFFEDDWFKNHEKKDWSNFYNYFGNLAYQTTDSAESQYLIQLLMSIFQKEKPVNLTTSQIEQITHLLMLSFDGIPGFTPLTDNELMPVKLIQNIYSNVYKLENYPPIIMGPDYFNEIIKAGKSIYYSHNYRCFYSFSPKVNKFSTTAKNFYRLLWAFKKALDFLKSSNSLHNNNALKHLTETHQFNFYHPGSKTYDEFLSPKLIPEQDKTIMQKRDKKFPHKIDFLNGCIQIRSQNSIQNQG